MVKELGEPTDEFEGDDRVRIVVSGPSLKPSAMGVKVMFLVVSPGRKLRVVVEME
jgi:hypothetical protein